MTACWRDGPWDAAVVGAGLAGSIAARGLAQRGLRVVVLEKAAFPRWKVCGDCLSRLGARTLEDIGLGAVIAACGGVAVERVEVRAGRAMVRTGGAGVWSVERGPLDARLAEEAAREGAVVLHGVRAEVRGGALVAHDAQGSGVVRTGVVVLASGLRAAGDGARVSPGAWMGVGVTDRGAGPGRPGITMAIGRGGYVGRVRLGDGAWNWAAALDPRRVREAGGPASLVASIWEGTGLDPGEVPLRGWQGTPALTRRRAVERGNVLAVGDAARFVEPITGEGMSWAIATGAAVVACAERAARGEPAGWARAYRRLVGARQARCAVVSRALRSPRLVEAALRAGAWTRADLTGVLGAIIGSSRGAAA